jgi:dihydroorotate dehydrogenase electron transfer subunit
MAEHFFSPDSSGAGFSGTDIPGTARSGTAFARKFFSEPVLANRSLGDNFYLLETGRPSGEPPRGGQFYMLRAWETYPVLSRPISVFDAPENRLVFLYKVQGEGTRIFSRLREGDPITLQGPLGRGFPEAGGTVALVGGGAGIAPLYLAAKQLKAALGDAQDTSRGTAGNGAQGGAWGGAPGDAQGAVHSGRCRVELFLGFSGAPFLTGPFEAAADRLTVKTGGFITDVVGDPGRYDRIFACGPEAMMEALFAKCEAAGAGDRLYVSLESRMACGTGACFVCSRKTRGGNKKVCKEGPVFPAREVFGL